MNQDENVISILENLLPEEKLKSILVVNNKCDLLRHVLIVIECEFKGAPCVFDLQFNFTKALNFFKF